MTSPKKFFVFFFFKYFNDIDFGLTVEIKIDTN